MDKIQRYLLILLVLLFLIFLIFFCYTKKHIFDLRLFGKKNMDNVASASSFSQIIYNAYGRSIEYSEFFANKDKLGKGSLILVLHSGIEKGNVDMQLAMPAVVSLLNYINKNKIKVLIIVPNYPNVDGPYPNDLNMLVVNLIEDKIKEFNIQNNKIYITGASYGGRAAYEMITDFNDMFERALIVSYVNLGLLLYETINTNIYHIIGASDKNIHLKNIIGFEDKYKCIESKVVILENKDHLQTIEAAYTDDVWDWIFDRNTIKNVLKKFTSK